jgi:hypothetical protein
MTTNREFDRQLADWLHETSAHRVPDHVTDVLLITRATRQRPWWSSFERWLPVSVLERQIVPVVRFPWRFVVVGALLLTLIAAALLFAGSQRHLAPPFGPAKNGTITFADVGDIYALDRPDASPRLLVGGLTSDAAPTFWRDGHLGFLRDTHVTGTGVALMEADADGSNVRQLVDLTDAPYWVDVSPDGRTIAMSAIYKGVQGLYFLDGAATGAPRAIAVGDGEIGWVGWRPTDGRELVYVESDAGGYKMYAVTPDGTARRLIRDLGVLDGNAANNLDPSISSDGRTLVYAVLDGNGFRNHLLDLDTGVDRQITLGRPDGHELHGTFSPDGTKLLFHEVNDAIAGLQELLAPIDGSEAAMAIGPVYPVVDGSADLGQEFSPDGRTIVILQGRDREIRLVDATTGGLGRTVAWRPQDLPGGQRLAP